MSIEEYVICKDAKYYSVNELKEVFFNNKEGFSEMAQILLDNDDFYKEMESRDGDGDARVMTPQEIEFFQKKNGKILKSFFKTFNHLI